MAKPAKKIASNSALRKTKTTEKSDAKSDTEFTELQVLTDLPSADGKSSIKLRLVQVGGDMFVDVRKFITTEKYTGPGRQGIMLPRSRKLLGQVIDALSEVRASIPIKPKK